MSSRSFIGYCIVSMRGGLTVDEQIETITEYLRPGFGELRSVYSEAAEWRKGDRCRELAKALANCQQSGATLMIARLERLSKDVRFLMAIEQSGVDFIVMDFPAATRNTISVIADLALYEQRLNSQKTRAVIEVKAATGSKFGRPENLSPDVTARARSLGTASNKARADEYAKLIGPIARSFSDDGASLSDIAQRFNSDRVLTASGHSGTWTATGVRNLLARYDSLQPVKASEPVANQPRPKFGL